MSLDPSLTSPLPLTDLCPHCLAVCSGLTEGPLSEADATIIMTIKDETGRRAVVRTTIAKALWDASEPVAGKLIVDELKRAHHYLKLQAQRELRRQKLREEESR